MGFAIASTILIIMSREFMTSRRCCTSSLEAGASAGFCCARRPERRNRASVRVRVIFFNLLTSRNMVAWLRFLAGMSRLGLGGFFGLGGIVAFAIDGGDFAAHGAEIGGELAAVVNGVNEA